MNALIEQCRRLGVRLWMEGTDLRYDAPKGAVTPDLLVELRRHKPGIVAALASPSLSGTTPEFAARLSAEDLEDIAASDIPLGTVQAFEQAAIAREAEDLKEAFEERAGILEFSAGLARADAELEAGTVDSLPFGHGQGPRARGRQARPRLGQYCHHRGRDRFRAQGPHCGKAGDVHRVAGGERDR